MLLAQTNIDGVSMDSSLGQRMPVALLGHLEENMFANKSYSLLLFCRLTWGTNFIVCLMQNIHTSV